MFSIIKIWNCVVSIFHYIFESQRSDNFISLRIFGGEYGCVDLDSTCLTFSYYKKSRQSIISGIPWRRTFWPLRPWFLVSDDPVSGSSSPGVDSIMNLTLIVYDHWVSPDRTFNFCGSLAYNLPRCEKERTMEVLGVVQES